MCTYIRAQLELLHIIPFLYSVLLLLNSALLLSHPLQLCQSLHLLQVIPFIPLSYPLGLCSIKYLEFIHEMCKLLFTQRSSRQHSAVQRIPLGFPTIEGYCPDHA